MISGTLKNIIYSQRIKKALAAKASSFNGNSGQTGLIIDSENLDSRLKLITLYNLIGIKEANFKIVVCGASNKVPEDIGAAILDPIDVSVTGIFKSEAIRDFSREPFDFLICYFSKKNRIGSLLAAESQATFKIGNSPDDYGIYDIEIKAKNTEVFQQEVLKYLKILKIE